MSSPNETSTTASTLQTDPTLSPSHQSDMSSPKDASTNWPPSPQTYPPKSSFQPSYLQSYPTLQTVVDKVLKHDWIPIESSENDQRSAHMIVCTILAGLTEMPGSGITPDGFRDLYYTRWKTTKETDAAPVDRFWEMVDREWTMMKEILPLMAGKPSLDEVFGMLNGRLEEELSRLLGNRLEFGGAKVVNDLDAQFEREYEELLEKEREDDLDQGKTLD